MGGFVEDTAAAIKNRTVVLVDPGGFTSGHIPDNIALLNHTNVIGSSISTSRLNALKDINTKDLMIFVKDFYKLDKTYGFNEDEIAVFSDMLIRHESYQAEDILHFLGEIPIIGSGSPSLGAQSTFFSDLWSLAQAMIRHHSSTPSDINAIVKRFISKCTINPAIAYGIKEYVGSIEVGKRADFILWKFESFAESPNMVFVGGEISSAAGESSFIPHQESSQDLPRFAATAYNGLRFVSRKAIDNVDFSNYLKSKAVPVKSCRIITQNDFPYHYVTGKLTVDPVTNIVHRDGQPLIHNESYYKNKHENFTQPQSFDPSEEIEINSGCKSTVLTMTNLSDRPIYLGSHIELGFLAGVGFIQVINNAIEFKFDSGEQMEMVKNGRWRLDIPSGGLVFFGPGERKNISIIKVKSTGVV